MSNKIIKIPTTTRNKMYCTSLVRSKYQGKPLYFSVFLQKLCKRSGVIAAAAGCKYFIRGTWRQTGSGEKGRLGLLLLCREASLHNKGEAHFFAPSFSPSVSQRSPHFSFSPRAPFFPDPISQGVSKKRACGWGVQSRFLPFMSKGTTCSVLYAWYLDLLPFLFLPHRIKITP